MRYELDDKIPYYGDDTIIHVYGVNVNYTRMESNKKGLTFRKLLTEACFDFDFPMPTYIIIEQPMGGEIYQIGNYTDNYIYEHGTTKGYA